MYKGYKIRIFPNKEQEKKLWNHINACRFIYNYMLELQTNNYKKGIKHMNKFDMMKKLTEIKHSGDYDWLNDVCCSSLQITCIDLENAYKNFFSKKMKYPRFKSKKKSKPCFPVRTERMKYNNGTVNIVSVGRLRIKKPIKDGKLCNARISYINEKWILSFQIKYDNQVSEKIDNNPMGIDLGVKDLAIVSFNNEKIVFGNINKSKRMKTLNHKLNYVNKIIMRKYMTNGNYEKTKAIIKYERIAKELYYKIANIRKNYIHNITHNLINLNPTSVTMETLNINGMMANRHMANAVQQQCLSEFIRQMKYKCEWSGIEFIQADRWFPSSKMCSCCGNIKKDLKLSDRMYKCECGLEIDRDYNAAINLMRYVSH